MPLPDTTVKFFTSSMSGAPVIGSANGSLITALDACLVNGFGEVTLNSLEVSSNVATGTISTGHQFAMIGDTGPVITIAGATPSALNGQWRIASVPNSTTFTFATSGISSQTATGTITAKRSPAGWEKTYSGTNKAVYSRLAASATAMKLRVNDGVAPQYAAVTMYEAMSDVDTGTGASSTGSVRKTEYSFGSSPAWRLYADDRLVYLFVSINGSYAYDGGLVFGDIISHKVGDAYHCVLIAGESGGGYGVLYMTNNANGSQIARSHLQTGVAVSIIRFSHYLATNYLGQAGNAWPAAADNGFHAWPVEVWESATVLRGILPGLYNPSHAAVPDGTIITGIPQLSGRTVFVQQCNVSASECAIDIMGPWR